MLLGDGDLFTSGLFSLPDLDFFLRDFFTLSRGWESVLSLRRLVRLLFPESFLWQELPFCTETRREARGEHTT